MDRIRTLLGKILHDETFKDGDINLKDGVISITEPKNKDRIGTLTDFSVVDVPNDVAVLSIDSEHLDKNGKLWQKYGGSGLEKFSWLLVDEHNYAQKKCDIVIFAKYDGFIHVVVVEVKSNYLDENKIRYQLKNSHLVLKYVLDMLHEYHIEDKKQIIYHYVVFSSSDRNINKKVIVAQKDEPLTKFIKIENHAEISFEKLVSI